MRRVKVACDDVTPFIGSDVHVRVLIRPRGGRQPGRGWTMMDALRGQGGDDEIVARVYTIRAVDCEKRQLWIDFLQHPAPGMKTPGGDFARDAQPGDRRAAQSLQSTNRTFPIEGFLRPGTPDRKTGLSASDGFGDPCLGQVHLAWRPCRKSTAFCAWAAALKMARLSSFSTLSQL